MKPIQDLSDAEFAALARQAAALPDAPAALVQAAIDLWVPPRPSLGDVARSLGRLIQGVLSFDSWAAAPAGAALAVRSAETDTRHLLYSAQGRDIDLRVAPSARQFVLAGQILGPDETGHVELNLADQTGATVQTALNGLGEFRIEGLSGGRYVLTLHVGQDTIVLPPLDVGPGPR